MNKQISNYPQPHTVLVSWPITSSFWLTPSPLIMSFLVPTDYDATERQTGNVGSSLLNIAKLLAGKEPDISLRCQGRRAIIWLVFFTHTQTIVKKKWQPYLLTENKIKMQMSHQKNPVVGRIRLDSVTQCVNLLWLISAEFMMNLYLQVYEQYPSA